jgi:16S rRNA (cytosine967-C5)-methyltransferase
MPANTPAAARAESAGLQARRLAVYLLKAVLYDKRTFDDAFAAGCARLGTPEAPLPSKLALASLPLKDAISASGYGGERAGVRGSSAGLEFRDRAFARAIAAMALRRLGQIEDLLRRFLEKPLPPEACEAQCILIAGAAQLAFMEVAPHAAISLAVEQAKGSRMARRYAGLVNAVLRKASASAATVTGAQDAARLKTPPWLYGRWAAHYGEETARLIASAHLEEPSLDLSVKADAEGWAGRLGGTLLPWGTVRFPAKGRIEDIEGYAEGGWWVQDAAAAIPALLLGGVRGLRVADLCAAPGGKTAQLAAAGAQVTAVDLSASRLRRLQENLARLNLKAEIVQADAAAWSPGEPFDAVLLDAPCSATGTIRRNPDIPYLKTEADIAALFAVQARLLGHAAGLLKPGGRLVFSTCSLEPEEGEAQIARLLTAHPHVVLVPIRADELSIPAECVDPAGMLRTLPFHAGGMDGFFAARLTVNPS